MDVGGEGHSKDAVFRVVGWKAPDVDPSVACKAMRG